MMPLGVVQQAAGAAGGISLPMTDAFTGTDGDDIDGRSTDTGDGVWSVVQYALEIGSNAATNTSATPGENGVAVVESEAADCVVSADIKVGWTQNSFGILIFRYVDINNYWRLQIVSGNDPSNAFVFVLTEITGGTPTDRDSATPTGSGGDFNTVEVTLDGTGITATFNGGDTLSYTSSSHQTATKHGFMLDDTTLGQDYIDDFSVTALP